MTTTPARKVGRPRAACGTVAACRSHRRRGETPCDPCAKAWAEAYPPRVPDLAKREQRKAAFRDDPNDPRHGTANGYANLNCRCQPCRDAWAAAHDAYLNRHPEQRIAATLRERRRRGAPDMTAAEMGLLSTDQAAAMLGVSRYQIGRLDLTPSLAIGVRLYYQPADVLAELVDRAKAQYGSAVTAALLAAARLDAEVSQ